ncbi:MAG: hypothetical protein JWO95_1633, partial [Verrucomicrobiales bacterium]|nr:hypothetical protein [Verrucomicrobiales bacterium]
MKLTPAFWLIAFALSLAGLSEAESATNHWAFRAPVRPAVPEVKSRWVRNPIDNFVLSRLQKEKLKPSPEADKNTLLRRLSLDVIGLPPKIEEIDSFVGDKTKDAYNNQVERLLASPHYGERWGRQWLDAARYADSDGYEKDKRRSVWFYRDYVINAFNRDLPYNQFVIEQLAGDQLPNPTQDQIVATGFLRNSMVNEEGGADPEQFRMEAMFDRMDCIGKSVLGLTIQCAQCHNHKFDPLKQEEYYRMFAFINNDYDAQRVVYKPDELMKVENLRAEMAKIEDVLKAKTPEWRERMNKWVDQVATNQTQWTVLGARIEDITTGGQKYIPQADGSLLAQGYAPTKHTSKFWSTNNIKGITAFQIELLNDGNLPCGGPGRSFMGTCALTEFRAEVSSVTTRTNTDKVKFVSATSDYEQPEHDLEPNFYDKTDKHRVTGPAKYAIDGNGDTAWGIDAGPGRRNQSRKAVFQCEKPMGFDGGTIFEIFLEQNHGGWNSDELMNNNLGRFRISVTTNTAPVVADPIPKAVRDIFAISREKRTPRQIATLFSYWRTTVPEWSDANHKIETLWKKWPQGDTTYTLLAHEKARETHVLTRGDFLKPQKQVTTGVPEFLHPIKPNASTRLDFAEWLVDRRSPTTARVIVNRIWQSYFGTGLVTTPEDFGTRAELPSHPELLDWLACELMDNGWSLKHVHRLILNSSTYRQSSHVTRGLLERDPINRLLARGPRLRVDGEIVRDIALAASGLLTTNLGGPSVYTPAPAFLFQPPASYAPFEWPEATGADRYRRAVYTFRRRSTPFP